MEAVPCDPEIPLQVLRSRETLGRAYAPTGMHKNADSRVVGNSKSLETTQISNDSGREKLWYFSAMDSKPNEPQLHASK